jgi:hypothetical protein
MQATQTNNIQYASFADSLDVQPANGVGVVKSVKGSTASNKLSAQSAFRVANDHSPDRDAFAGSLFADCLFGAVLGLPTVDIGGGLEAGLDNVVDAVDEFWCEMRKRAEQQANAQIAAAPVQVMPVYDRKGRETAPQAWDSWAFSASKVAPAPVM